MLVTDACMLFFFSICVKFFLCKGEGGGIEWEVSTE